MGNLYLSVHEHCCNKKQYPDQEARLYPEIRAIDPVYASMFNVQCSHGVSEAYALKPSSHKNAFQ